MGASVKVTFLSSKNVFDDCIDTSNIEARTDIKIELPIELTLPEKTSMYREVITKWNKDKFLLGFSNENFDSRVLQLTIEKTLCTDYQSNITEEPFKI